MKKKQYIDLSNVPIKATTVGDFQYMKFTKPDSAGGPVYQILADVTQWYLSTSSNIFGGGFLFKGLIIPTRVDGYLPAWVCLINCQLSYYNDGLSNSKILETSYPSFISPVVISRDSRYYLALKLAGSNFVANCFVITKNVSIGERITDTTGIKEVFTSSNLKFYTQ